MQEHEFVAAVAGSSGISQLPPDYADLLGTEPVHHH
jgi:hypothetical protein